MVEVLHYETANKNKTIGYVDIRVPITQPTVLIFRKVAHFQNGDRKWFNLPAFTRHSPEGTPNYLKFCEFETQANNNTLMEVLADKVKDFCEEHGIVPIETLNFQEFPENGNVELKF